ncbi:MAG: phage terminase small subunit P27 family [Anaerolineaceae bacterium]
MARTSASITSRATCPQWLDAAAKAEWRRLAPELERRGYLTPLDRAAFAGYCLAYSDWRRCLVSIERFGAVYISASGRVMERPEMQLSKEYGRAMRSFATDLGLTPSSRARMPAAANEAEMEKCCPRCSLPLDFCGCQA